MGMSGSPAPACLWRGDGFAVACSSSSMTLPASVMWVNAVACRSAVEAWASCMELWTTARSPS